MHRVTACAHIHWTHRSPPKALCPMLRRGRVARIRVRSQGHSPAPSRYSESAPSRYSESAPSRCSESAPSRCSESEQPVSPDSTRIRVGPAAARRPAVRPVGSGAARAAVGREERREERCVAGHAAQPRSRSCVTVVADGVVVQSGHPTRIRPVHVPNKSSSYSTRK